MRKMTQDELNRTMALFGGLFGMVNASDIMVDLACPFLSQAIKADFEPEIIESLTKFSDLYFAEKPSLVIVRDETNRKHAGLTR